MQLAQSVEKGAEGFASDAAWGRAQQLLAKAQVDAQAAQAQLATKEKIGQHREQQAAEQVAQVEEEQEAVLTEQEKVAIQQARPPGLLTAMRSP